MNKKGFAISIVLYSIVFVLISIFYMLLGIVKVRYTVSNNLREDLMENLNSFRGADVLKRKIDASSCNSVRIDNMNTDNTNDDVIYFSGSNDCVNYNYVWYSGKLWRIIAIYPDGAMKMVTDSHLVTLYIGGINNVKFYINASTNTIMYKWLNEDFLDSLYNYENVIDSSKKWNQTPVSSDDEVHGYIPTRLGNTDLFSANVALLNTYELYMSSYNATEIENKDSFVYDGSLLLNLDTKTKGYFGMDGIPVTNLYNASFRPTIYVKSSVEIASGNGTKEKPFTFAEDKKSGSVNDYINTRLSGEYIQFASNGDKYRIVGIENSTTKIAKDGILIPDNYANLVMDKEGITSNYFGNGTCAGTGTWYTYLNDTWYPSLVNRYGNLFTTGKYYHSSPSHDGTNADYRLSICVNKEPIKTCTKLTYDSFNVGTLRHGEMFSRDEGVYSGYIALITKTNGTDFCAIDSGDIVDLESSITGGLEYPTYVKPTLNLKSTVKIKSGSGTKDDPYIVGL